MKKTALIVLAIALTVGLFAATLKPLTWELRLDDTSLPDVNNKSNTTAEQYSATVINLANPTEVIQTGRIAPTLFSINHTGNGTTVLYWVRIFFNCAAFAKQWNAGETLLVNVTHIPSGQSACWTFTIPDDGSRGELFRYPDANKIIPPYSKAIYPTTPAEAISPAHEATKIGFRSQTLSWNPPLVDKAHQAVLGYKVYFGTKLPALPSEYITETANTTFVTGSLKPNTKYYWKVVPFNSYGEAENCPVWTFSTGNSVKTKQ